MSSYLKNYIYRLLDSEFDTYFNFPFDLRKSGLQISFNNSGVDMVRNVLFTVYVFTPYGGKNTELQHIDYHNSVRNLLVNAHLVDGNGEFLNGDVVIGYPFDENDTPSLIAENFYISSMSFNLVDIL